MSLPPPALRAASRALVLAVCVLSLRAAPPAPSAGGVPLDIGVRSTVEAKWVGGRKFAPVVHGKIYLLAAATEGPSAEKIIKPVDRAALAAQLRQELSRHGFREITAREIPDVVLTVTYGRGYLRNPYLADAMLDEVTTGVPTATITSPQQAMRQREFNAEEKLQRAQFEKLFVAVTAWQYPAGPGAKPNQLWRTVMVVDNPAGRDLNLALPAMLAAGAGWFGRDSKEGEVTVQSTMPSGTVKLGPLEVLATGK
jgi:hypothetical protein